MVIVSIKNKVTNTQNIHYSSGAFVLYSEIDIILIVNILRVFLVKVTFSIPILKTKLNCTCIPTDAI